jgi:Transposase
MARSKRSVEKERFWRSMLRRQRQEGVSVREFCRRNSLSEPSFYAWRRELHNREAERDDVGARRGDAPGKRQLIPVEVVDSIGRDDSRASGTKLPLEICTPGGFTLRFDHQASPETISRLLNVIGRRQPLTEAGEGGTSC